MFALYIYNVLNGYGGDKVEQNFYELKPYAIVLVGLYGLSQVMISTPAAVFGLILLGCSAMIIKWRSQHRTCR